MAKEAKDRKPLFIRTSKPVQLKRELASYKTAYRQDWKTLFWMIVHDGRNKSSYDHPIYGKCIEISWTMDNKRASGFEIIRPDEETIEVYREEREGEITALNGDTFTMTTASDLDDNLAAQYILMESPDNMKLRIESLTEATKEYLNNPQVNDPSPFMNMLIKRGYSMEVRGNFLWVYRGG